MSRQQRRHLHLDIRLTGIYEDHWGHTQQADLGDHQSTGSLQITGDVDSRCWTHNEANGTKTFLLDLRH